MVNVPKRMARMRELLNIRLGPGAAVLPPDVKRIHLDFAIKIDGGHRGPRHFWRQYLPRLKYHNPAIPMTVTRGTDNAGPATLSIFFAQPSPGTATPTSTPTIAPVSTSTTTSPNTSTAAVTATTASPPTERVTTIPMKFRQESEILAEFLDVTRAVPVEPSEADEDLALQLAERRKVAEETSRLSHVRNEKRRKEQAFLNQAREAVMKAKPGASVDVN